MRAQSPLILSSAAYAYMADRVADETGYERGTIVTEQFPDGEYYRRIECPVLERDIILMAGTTEDEEAVALFDLGCTLSRMGARSLTMVIPYYGYSTMERAVKLGEVVTAKTRASLLSAVPPAARGNRILLLDLHNEGITHYFEGGTVAIHLYAKSVVLEMCRDFGGDNFVLASTDAGRAKWVESLANDLGVGAAFIFKRRIDGEKTEIRALAADVKGRRVVIYDDMIRTGGSLINAAKAYLEAGASEVCAIATHGVLPGNAAQKLRDSGVLTAVGLTDSHPRVLDLGGDFFHVRSVSGIFADFLKAEFGT